MSESTQNPEKETKVSWLELFFDLVFVAALSLINDDLREDFTLERLGFIVVALAALFVIWLTVTLISNRFPDDGEYRRILVLIVMATLLMSALSASDAVGIEPQFGQVSLALTLVALGAMFLPIPRKFDVPARPMIESAVLLWVAGAFTAAFAFIPLPGRGELVVVAAAVLLVGIVVGLLQDRALRHHSTVKSSHLTERLGLLIIILLGEGLVVMTVTLREPDAQLHAGFLIMTFVMIFLLWHYFFDGTFDTDNAPLRWRMATIATFLLIFGLVGMLDIYADLVASNTMSQTRQDIIGFALASVVTFIGFITLTYAQHGVWNATMRAQVLFTGANLILVTWVIATEQSLPLLAVGTGLIIGLNVLWAVVRRRIAARDLTHQR